MNIDERKKKILKSIASTKDLNKISMIEQVLFPVNKDAARIERIRRLSGIWSAEEANEMERLIAEVCEKPDENEW